MSYVEGLDTQSLWGRRKKVVAGILHQLSERNVTHSVRETGFLSRLVVRPALEPLVASCVTKN